MQYSPMFSEEENKELNETAFDLAYHSIRFSGLYKELENSEWDLLAVELGRVAREAGNRVIEARLEQIASKAA